MPWQQHVATIGGELIPETGLPAFRDVVVTIPRQSGKTTIVLGWKVQRARGWEHLGPQRISYSAQNGSAARKKLVRDWYPLLNAKKGPLGIKNILRGMGNEAVEFKNGSLITLLASTEDAGHGETIDLAIKDELFADEDDRRDQALKPAMVTRPAAQVVTTSTMGTAESEALNRAVERGRRAVLEGKRDGIAYFEWAADPEADPYDPRVWWSCMPALGITVTEQVIRHNLETLSLPEFKRAFLNIMDDRKGDPVIPRDAWKACEDPESAAVGEVCFAIDVAPDRSSAAIGVAGARFDDLAHVEVVEHRPGTGWVVDAIVELRDANRPRSIVLDAAGPAQSLLHDLEDAGVEVRVISTREYQAACGAFYDDVLEAKLRHLGQEPLDGAVDGADKRVVTDAWLWSRRRSSVDISPLVAVTLAHWAHGEPKGPSGYVLKFKPPKEPDQE